MARKVIFLLLLVLLPACASNPLPKTLALKRPPKLAIISFKVTAPIKHLSSIIKEPPKNLSPEQEKTLLDTELRRVEDRATEFLVQALEKDNEIEPIVIPEDVFGISRGERPTDTQINELKEQFGVDAVLYGRIPRYGKAPLIYPILGESADITIETVILGAATSWNPGVIFGNIGFELLTSTPLWFGGTYILGWAFRPVTVTAWVVSTENDKEIFHKSVDRVVSRKILKTYPKSERSKKEIQLESSLHGAVNSLAESLRRSSWFSDLVDLIL